MDDEHHSGVATSTCVAPPTAAFELVSDDDLRDANVATDLAQVEHVTAAPEGASAAKHEHHESEPAATESRFVGLSNSTSSTMLLLAACPCL